MVVGRQGRIPEPCARAAVKAAGKLRRRAEAARAERLVVVATSAPRDARNREKVARRIAAAAGGPVRISRGTRRRPSRTTRSGLRCPWANAELGTRQAPG